MPTNPTTKNACIKPKLKNTKPRWYMRQKNIKVQHRRNIRRILYRQSLAHNSTSTPVWRKPSCSPHCCGIDCYSWHYV